MKTCRNKTPKTPFRGEVADTMSYFAPTGHLRVPGQAERARRGTSSSSEVPPQHRNHIAPPSDRPSDNQKNDGYILRDHNCFRPKWAQQADAHLRRRCAQKNPPDLSLLVLNSGLHVWRSRVKESSCLCSYLTGGRKLPPCMRKRGAPCRTDTFCAQSFHHTRVKRLFLVSAPTVVKPASDARGVPI